LRLFAMRLPGRPRIAALLRGGFYVDRISRRDRIVDPAKNLRKTGFDGGDEELGAEMAFVRQPKEAAGEKGEARGHGKLICEKVAAKDRIRLDSHFAATIPVAG
jgi:hypothetical protein